MGDARTPRLRSEDCIVLQGVFEADSTAQRGGGQVSGPAAAGLFLCVLIRGRRSEPYDANEIMVAMLLVV